jgi:succinate-acetate transporter protein
LVSALIYAALGLLGLNTGLMILVFCNFGMIKAKEGVSLPNGQAAWFLWVAGVAELFAAAFFFGVGDTLDAATFAGFGLFWVGLGTFTFWGGEGKVLGPMAIAYAIFSAALTPAYMGISWTLGLVLLFLVFIFLAIIPAAWGKANAKVLGTLQLICFLITMVAIFGLVWASLSDPYLNTLGTQLLLLR